MVVSISGVFVALFMSSQNAFLSFFSEFWRRVPGKYLWLIPVDIFAIALAITVIPRWSEVPKLSAEVQFSGHAQVVIDSSQTLRVGDTIVAIAGQNIRTDIVDHDAMLRALKLKRAGETVRVDVQRAGARVLVQDILRPYFTLDKIRAMAAFDLFTLALGIVVFLVRPANWTSILFNLMTIGLLLMDLSWTVWSDLPLLIRASLWSFLLLNSAVILHFLTIFPREHSWRWWVIIPSYVLFGACFVAEEIRVLEGDPVQTANLLLLLSGLQVYLYPLMNVAAIAISLYIYFSTKSQSERRRLRSFMFGSGISAFWFALMVNLPRLLNIPVHVSPWLTAAGYFFAPLGFAVGLIWYNILDIDLILSRTLVYALVLGLLVVSYEAINQGLIYLLGLGLAGNPPWYISLIATAIIAAGFDPVRDRIRTVVDRFFYRATGDPALANSDVSDIRELVEDKGGEIEVEAEDETGRHFRFRLPKER